MEERLQLDVQAYKHWGLEKAFFARSEQGSKGLVRKSWSLECLLMEDYVRSSYYAEDNRDS